MASEKDRDADVGASESVSTSRRSFLFVLGAASAVAVSGGVAHALAPRSESGRVARRSSKSGAATGHALIEQLPAGTRLHTSTVAAVHAIKLGAVAVVMRRPDGSAFQLDVLQRSERDSSIAQSARCSVFAVNGGTGSLATSEPDGLAAMALARSLAAAERAGMPALDLLTHSERARRHPAGTFRVPV